MCGFFGYLTGKPVEDDVLRQGVAALRHRGPDDSGLWRDPDAGIALGHARLSIVELSAAGHQPMASASGRYVLAYNGEIYNHSELRLRLQESRSAVGWRGRSDTETLLAGFDAWGVAETVACTIGMFAFAVWDRRTRRVSLVRDRAGEKPLYYGWQNDVLLFGSELTAFHSLPGFQRTVDRGALALLMRHGYIPAPYSVYLGIRKVMPGTVLTFGLDSRDGESVTYWSAGQAMAAGHARPFDGSPDEAVDVLDELLGEAVRGQLMSDVPLGAFLSGGVDSSTVVALMQEQSGRPVRTFTIGFHEPAYNEAESAARVARHLNTDHTELYVTPQQVMDVVPNLPALYSEPFADASQIPTALVSALARRHVAVSLSGDAGDELFGGYNRYVLTQQLWTRLSRIPVALRAGVAHAVLAVPVAAWDRILGPIQPFLPGGLAQRNVGDKVAKAAGVMTSRTPLELYRRLISQWPNPELLIPGAQEPSTALTSANGLMREENQVHGMMALDFLTYLPDDILVKVDRAAMGVSLETRVPFLDHRVIEFAWRLPLEYKVRQGVGKWPLRQVLYRRVPRELIERPKMGFGVPIDSWLRGPLRPWAEELLSESRLATEGYFDPRQVRKVWAEHLGGRRNWQYRLWAVLMFQAWLEHEGRRQPVGDRA
jgi:asparagine synthase (glutamine-hydrolysing)